MTVRAATPKSLVLSAVQGTKPQTHAFISPRNWPFTFILPWRNIGGNQVGKTDASVSDESPIPNPMEGIKLCLIKAYAKKDSSNLVECGSHFAGEQTFWWILDGETCRAPACSTVFKINIFQHSSCRIFLQISVFSDFTHHHIRLDRHKIRSCPQQQRTTDFLFARRWRFWTQWTQDPKMIMSKFRYSFRCSSASYFKIFLQSDFACLHQPPTTKPTRLRRSVTCDSGSGRTKLRRLNARKTWLTIPLSAHTAGHSDLFASPKTLNFHSIYAQTRWSSLGILSFRVDKGTIASQAPSVLGWQKCRFHECIKRQKECTKENSTQTQTLEICFSEIMISFTAP